ncbi:MAG: branched-chain amino acid ABC transporter permease [Candidatus Dormibacteria bacterium]
MSSWQYYASTLLVFWGVNTIAVWALNLQFGVAGIVNFAFIVFQSVGAYTAAVLTLGPASSAGYEHYVGGMNLPFPLPIIAGAVAGAVVAIPVGLLGLRRLRSDYQAMIMLIVSLIATDLASSQPNLVNGAAGLFSIPQPLSDQLNLSQLDYQWFYVVLVAVIALGVYLFVRRVTNSPHGRMLRAIRDNPETATAIGKNVTASRMTVFVVGGAIAGLSGALLAGYISAWAPGSWLYPETFVYLAAVIVGGRANNFGVMLGALVVPGFGEVTRFFPQLVDPQTAAAMEWIGIGAFMVLFLWFWPRGIIPERRRRFAWPKPAVATPTDNAAGVD